MGHLAHIQASLIFYLDLLKTLEAEQYDVLDLFVNQNYAVQLRFCWHDREKQAEELCDALGRPFLQLCCTYQTRKDQTLMQPFFCNFMDLALWPFGSVQNKRKKRKQNMSSVSLTRTLFNINSCKHNLKLSRA